MEIKDFVSQSLMQIMEGVKDAQSKSPGIINPIVPLSDSEQKQHVTINQSILQSVEFDIAVTVFTEGTQKGGIAVFAGFGGLGGQKQSGYSDTVVSRLKFTVPVVFPQSQPKEPKLHGTHGQARMNI
jgi:hypothetical protein